MAADDDEFMGALNRSARSIGGDDFREWVDEQYAELLKQRRHPEDITLRHELVQRPAPGMILATVAAAAGTTMEELKARRRGGIWKGARQEGGGCSLGAGRRVPWDGWMKAGMPTAPPCRR